MSNTIRHEKSRGKFHYDPELKQWVDEEFYVDYEKENPRERKAPMVIMDTMTPTKHMVNGRFYDSKSEFRRVTKSLGYEEIGREVMKAPPKKTRYTDEERQALKAEITKAYTDVRDGNAPLSELDKERCKIINRQIKNKP